MGNTPNTGRPPNNVERVVRLTVLIPESVHERIKELAAADTRSKSAQALHLIKLGLYLTKPK